MIRANFDFFAPTVLNACCDILGVEPVGFFPRLTLVRPFLLQALVPFKYTEKNIAQHITFSSTSLSSLFPNFRWKSVLIFFMSHMTPLDS